MNLPEPQSLTFSSLMSDIEKGNIKIPQFQRDFVWNKDKSAKLLDSIVKGYPIGTFILWKTKEELRALRNLGGLNLPKTPKGDFIHYVLDGQQRLTTLFASLKGLKIKREEREDDYSDFHIDLEAEESDPIVLNSLADTNHHKVIKLHDLLYGKLKMLSGYPEPLQDKIQGYKDRINAYQFSAVLIKEAPIDVATEIFTRLNVGGKPLSVFEIMVAKTFDSKRDFDLAEKFDQLSTELESVDYGTLPASVVLQTVSILLVKECRKKDILKLPRKKVIDIWPAAADAVKNTVDYFRNAYRIPVSQLLPYPNLVVPFAYYFYKKGRKPTGKTQKYLEDFFWRAAFGGRYSQSVDSRLAQDVRKIDAIIAGRIPKYEWAVDTSAKFIEDNGWFSVGRAYIKALLCILAFKEPKSFIDNSIVRISNDWLKQANSRNYHHFFPKAFLKKKGEAEEYINHIANITIVDDFLNKREIRAQAPSKYMRRFARQNAALNKCMRTHLINQDTFGVFQDDFDKFFRKRCQAFSRELKKRIIEQGVDGRKTPVPAKDTMRVEME
ncbi:MAG: DUF262 domain-containing protein [Desulfobacterales bacterium]|uniref:DUF262 domain-containing protein n=1 Tax=Candidatus Desulfatibia vada TaxID=2841696 RepID=A0A8J6TTQ0_9BACT|nr:DUF262 domain-containing protein [Candidatus Desulfatibia vada]